MHGQHKRSVLEILEEATKEKPFMIVNDLVTEAIKGRDIPTCMACDPIEAKAYEREIQEVLDNLGIEGKISINQPQNRICLTVYEDTVYKDVVSKKQDIPNIPIKAFGMKLTGTKVLDESQFIVLNITSIGELAKLHNKQSTVDGFEDHNIIESLMGVNCLFYTESVTKLPDMFGEDIYIADIEDVLLTYKPKIVS